MLTKRLIEDLVQEVAPGPAPSFMVYDVVRFLRLVANEGFAGRMRISKSLGLGEGATRTLILRLKRRGLISTSRRGCRLTERGEKVWRDLKSSMPIIVELREEDELALAQHTVAVLVKGGGARVRKGLEQRDASVRAGAKGATTILIEGGKMILPAVSTNLERDYPKAFKQIAESLKPQNGDVVIICSADSLREAEYGAIAAAWTVI